MEISYEALAEFHEKVDRLRNTMPQPPATWAEETGMPEPVIHDQVHNFLDQLDRKSIV